MIQRRSTDSPRRFIFEMIGTLVVLLYLAFFKRAVDWAADPWWLITLLILFHVGMAVLMFYVIVIPFWRVNNFKRRRKDDEPPLH